MTDREPGTAVTVLMPYRITAELLRAVRNDPLCKCEDPEQMHVRIGWLVCAYDAMIAAEIGRAGGG